MSKKATQLKERMKALKNFQHQRHVEEKPNDVEFKISELQSQIVSCEYDLKTFPNNRAIIRKIEDLKNRLKNLEEDR